ncbi:MAG TPA: DUF1993 domain-containing protein [Steroidobacteraceae bacterium]|nr:DUF1993 domain-containing protein [Steroidobacteraceae bacterium]
MKISMYALSAGQFLPMLGSLRLFIEKAEASAKARNFDVGVLMAARLAPDMFPFNRQVQLTCDFAKNSCARLAGLEAPRFEDTETTAEELKARIDKTIAYVKTVPATAFEGQEDRDIKIPLRDRTLEMKGLPFLQNWALTNFYFHATTAYNILRHSGVDLGKRDFLGT